MERGLVKIGKLTRLHGIKGALLLHTDGAAYPDIQKARTFFVEINGVPTPFFVSEIKILGKNLVLAFDTVKTTGEAQKLVGKEAWLEPRFILKEKKQEDLTGYRVVDAEKGDLGTIKEIIEMPGQRMFALEVGGKEVLLPFNEDLIEKKDVKAKMAMFDSLPDKCTTCEKPFDKKS